MNDMDKLKQQIHKRCGGSIVVCADKQRQAYFVCDKCAEMWSSGFTSVSVPDDVRDINKKDGVKTLTKEQEDETLESNRTL